MQTPRPTVIITPSYSPIRQKAWIKHITTLLAKSATDERLAKKVLSRYRRRQTIKLGLRDEDPNPYDSDYIFYCLDMPRAK